MIALLDALDAERFSGAGHDEVDGANPPSTSAEVASKFSGPSGKMTLVGVGHFPQREAAAVVAAKLVAHFTAGDREDAGGS